MSNLKSKKQECIMRYVDNVCGLQKVMGYTTSLISCLVYDGVGWMSTW